MKKGIFKILGGKKLTKKAYYVDRTFFLVIIGVK